MTTDVLSLFVAKSGSMASERIAGVSVELRLITVKQANGYVDVFRPGRSCKAFSSSGRSRAPDLVGSSSSKITPGKYVAVVLASRTV